MQKILIPTDFSPIANNAFDYAIQIANEFRSKLLLYHVYTFYRKVDFNKDYPEDQQPFIKRKEKQMSLSEVKFTDKIEQLGLTIQTKLEEDSIISLFDQKVKEHNASLIVMGSKGASGIKKVIFGSVAATALEMAKVPVLVVPPNHPFSPIKKIVFATDLKQIDSNILSPIHQLAVQFNASITILNVNSDISSNSAGEHYFPLEDIDTYYKEIPMLSSVNESINEFLEQNEFDLICMVRREKGFFERFLQPSVSINQVYNSKIPLLVLPEK
jgi:nucleotide-binding universal stress UspA family protein